MIFYNKLISINKIIINIIKQLFYIFYKYIYIIINKSNGS